MQSCVTSNFASGAVGFAVRRAQISDMARKVKKPNAKARLPTQIKAWRKHHGMSLERLAERLALQLDFDISEAQLSRIERGQQPYSQDLLEALAVVLRTTPAALLNVDPAQSGGIASIWETLTPVQQTQVAEIALTLKRTGTDG